jgi:hypothetical protein
VNIDIGKVMKLFPGTIEMVKKIARGKKRTVKFQAVGNTHRKQKEITGGNAPRKRLEKPYPQPVGKIKSNFISKFFHKPPRSKLRGISWLTASLESRQDSGNITRTD